MLETGLCDGMPAVGESQGAVWLKLHRRDRDECFGELHVHHPVALFLGIEYLSSSVRTVGPFQSNGEGFDSYAQSHLLGRLESFSNALLAIKDDLIIPNASEMLDATVHQAVNFIKRVE